MPPPALFNSENFGLAQPGFTPPQIPALMASDIAYVAYRIAGILPEPGRGYSGSEGVDALRILNSLLNSMQAERLMVYAYVRTVFTITPNQQSYAVGSVTVNGVAPDWFLPDGRPEEITLAGYVFNQTQPFVENPMKVLTYQEWAALSPKNLVTQFAYMLYYQADIPNGTCFLWPIPTDPSVTVALYTWQNILQVPALTTALILPPAYQELLEYGLAIRLAGMFPRRARLDPNAAKMYDQARTKVMSANVPKLQSQCEVASGGVRQRQGRYNILTNSTIGGLGGSGW